MSLPKGWKHTEQTKQKMRGREETPEQVEKKRLRQLGKRLSEEARKKISEANKGRKQTKEHIEKKLAWMQDREKLSKARIQGGLAQRGKILSTVHRQQISVSRKGKPLSKSHRLSIGNAHKGRKRLPEHIEKWSARQRGVARPNIVGEKNPNWRGGKVRNKTPGTYTIVEWESLKIRYNFTCPCCHRSEPEIKLEKDHVVPVSLGGLNIIENIQPLCVRCNRSKHNKIIYYRINRFRSVKRELERLESILSKKEALGLKVDYELAASLGIDLKVTA
jgi:5-methylcytosine-specific restriction endonuclease McrA